MIDLIRLEYSRDGVFGVLRINKEVFCVTLEQLDLNNIQNISCIPADHYVCERELSPKFGEVFLVKDVPNRSRILFHVGNTIKDTRGCILLGESFGEVKGQKAILNSRKTIEKFMGRLAPVECCSFMISSWYPTVWRT